VWRMVRTKAYAKGARPKSKSDYLLEIPVRSVLPSLPNFEPGFLRRVPPAQHELCRRFSRSVLLRIAAERPSMSREAIEKLVEAEWNRMDIPTRQRVAGPVLHRLTAELTGPGVSVPPQPNEMNFAGSFTTFYGVRKFGPFFDTFESRHFTGGIVTSDKSVHMSAIFKAYKNDQITATERSMYKRQVLEGVFDPAEFHKSLGRTVLTADQRTFAARALVYLNGQYRNGVISPQTRRNRKRTILGLMQQGHLAGGESKVGTMKSQIALTLGLGPDEVDKVVEMKVGRSQPAGGSAPRGADVWFCPRANDDVKERGPVIIPAPAARPSPPMKKPLAEFSAAGFLLCLLYKLRVAGQLPDYGVWKRSLYASALGPQKRQASANTTDVMFTLLTMLGSSLLVDSPARGRVQEYVRDALAGPEIRIPKVPKTKTVSLTAQSAVDRTAVISGLLHLTKRMAKERKANATALRHLRTALLQAFLGCPETTFCVGDVEKKAAHAVGEAMQAPELHRVGAFALQGLVDSITAVIEFRSQAAATIPQPLVAELRQERQSAALSTLAPVAPTVVSAPKPDPVYGLAGKTLYKALLLVIARYVRRKRIDQREKYLLKEAVMKTFLIPHVLSDTRRAWEARPPATYENLQSYLTDEGISDKFALFLEGVQELKRENHPLFSSI